MLKIEEKYNNHIVPDDIKEGIDDPYILILNIEDIVKELRKEETGLLRRRRRNRITQKVSVFNTDILKEEDKVYGDIIKLIDENIDMLISIKGLVDENNYIELVKLVDFMVDEYTHNKEYFNAELHSIDYATRGFTYIDNRQNNSHNLLKAFVSKKIIDMKAQKLLEKK